jgi:hypothetical protein
MNENFSEFTNTFIELENILPPNQKITELDEKDLQVVNNLTALSPSKEYILKKSTPVASIV